VAVTREEGDFVCQVLVIANVAFVVVIGRRQQRRVVLSVSGNVRERQIAKDAQSELGEGGGGNDAIAIGFASVRILDRDAKAASPLLGCGHAAEGQRSLQPPQAFIIGEERDPVFLQRTAEGGAILILNVDRLLSARGFEEPHRVQ